MEKITDSRFLKEEIKRDYYIHVVGVLALVVLLLIGFNGSILIYQIYNGLEKSDSGFVNNYYESMSAKFSNHRIILEISNECELSNNPVRCVFDKIPMNYDYSRINSSFPVFRTPSDYFEFGGVCRDYTVLRHSALSNLGINCMFNFIEERHVYLNCFYEGKFYELNNDYFNEWKA